MIKPEAVETQTITYKRAKAKKKRGSDCVTDSGLRFDDTVPVEVIEVASPELQGADADQYEVIGVKSLHRLAQRPASFVVLRYDQPVVKRKGSNDISQTSAPATSTIAAGRHHLKSCHFNEPNATQYRIIATHC